MLNEEWSLAPARDEKSEMKEAETPDAFVLRDRLRVPAALNDVSSTSVIIDECKCYLAARSRKKLLSLAFRYYLLTCSLTSSSAICRRRYLLSVLPFPSQLDKSPKFLFLPSFF